MSDGNSLLIERLQHGLNKRLELEPEDQLKIVVALNAKALSQTLNVKKKDVVAFLDGFNAAESNRKYTVFSAQNAGTSAHAVEGYLRGRADPEL